MKLSDFYKSLGFLILFITILPPVFSLDLLTLLLGILFILLGKEEAKEEKVAVKAEDFDA